MTKKTIVDNFTIASSSQNVGLSSFQSAPADCCSNAPCSLTLWRGAWKSERLGRLMLCAMTGLVLAAAQSSLAASIALTSGSGSLQPPSADTLAPSPRAEGWQRNACFSALQSLSLFGSPPMPATMECLVATQAEDAPPDADGDDDDDDDDDDDEGESDERTLPPAVDLRPEWASNGGL